MHPTAEPEVDPEADPEIDPVGRATAPGVAPVDEVEAAPGPDPEVDPATVPVDEAETALVAMALAEVAHPVAASLAPS